MANKIDETSACAVSRNVPISAQKMRLVADLVRGKKATEAIALLRFTPKTAAEPISKAIASAVANAVENKQMNAEDLVVSEITVDGAPLRQWRRFAARGRFRPIIRRSSHVSVVVSQG
ncbi:MAG: 50S ribosomal protein L22 [Thermoflexales bacterium]|nr:50S ribosomal protein L22 [Thermoflexales bacterium]